MRTAILFLFLAIISCTENKNGHIKINPNEKHQEIKFQSDLTQLGLEIIKDRYLLKGEKSCVSIFLKNNKYKLNRGYIGCELDSIYYIDIDQLEIGGCKKKMYMVGDTIKFYFTPLDTGLANFYNITLLFSDKAGKFFIADTTFKINVIDKGR